MAGAKKITKKSEVEEKNIKLAPAASGFMPLLLILAIALGVTYFIVSYETALSHNFGASPVRQPAVSAVQLENIYQAKLTAILGDYLKTADVADQQFLTRTEQLKNSLLALIVPAKYRDKHLALVLSLNKIEIESQNGNLQAAAQEMEKIRQSY